MTDKKEGVKKRKLDKSIVFLMIILVVFSILLFKNPAITGKVIQSKETVYSENLNLKVNESGAYEWNLKNPGNIKSLKVTGSVTSNGTAKVYIEKNGTKQLLFDSTKQLFDVDIHVLPEYKKVLQGGEILIQNVLFNLRGFGSGNVNVKYSLKDPSGKLIASEEEKIFVATQAKFIRKLVIPEGIEPGSFTAFVEASVNGTVLGTGSDTFEVTAKNAKSYNQQFRYYASSIAIVIALVIALILGIYGLGLLKKKKGITELKEKAPEERRRKMEGELRALEEAHKSGFISKESYGKEKKRIEKRLGILRK